MENGKPDIISQIQAELAALDINTIQIEGKDLKPSQCYHFSVDPAHVLFNTNCPDTLRQQVQNILYKYLPHESGAQ